MALVVSFRKAHDASPTTIFWPDPQVYVAHRKRRTLSANQAHQPPGAGKGLGLDHDNFDRPYDNKIHRHPRVADYSAARDDNSNRRAGDRDHRRPGLGGDPPLSWTGLCRS